MGKNCWVLIFSLFTMTVCGQVQNLTMDKQGNVLNPSGANFPSSIPLKINGTAFQSAPGNSKYYGTNGSGTLGYFNFPTGTIESTTAILMGDGSGNAIASNITQSDAFFDLRTDCLVCDAETNFIATNPTANSVKYSLTLGSYIADFKLLTSGNVSLDAPSELKLSGVAGITFYVGNVLQAQVTSSGIVNATTGFSKGGTEFPIASNGIPIRTAANTWSVLTIGTGLNLTGTTLAVNTPTPTPTATPTATATATATATPTPTATPTATAVTLTIDGVAQQIDTDRTWNEDHSVTFVVDGAGIVLGTGTKNPVKIPFGGTLQGWTTTCKPSCSITIDVFRAADGAGLPVTSIVGLTGTKPFITTAVENSGTDFTNWTSTTLTAKDNLAISLSGITAATYVELTLYYK